MIDWYEKKWIKYISSILCLALLIQSVPAMVYGNIYEKNRKIVSVQSNDNKTESEPINKTNESFSALVSPADNKLSGYSIRNFRKEFQSNSFENLNHIVIKSLHPPQINNKNIEGSIWLLNGETMTLGGNTCLNGDIYLPGTPDLQVKGKASYEGIIEGTGNTEPSDYSLILKGKVSVGNINTRTDPVLLSQVQPPPDPTGTRKVVLQKSSDDPGDFSTILDLTVKGNAGNCSVPPGNYGIFKVQGGNGLIFGISGSSIPSVYNFQELHLSGNSRIDVVGPVCITLNKGLTNNCYMGHEEHAEWLTLQVADNNCSFNGNCIFYGNIIAPHSVVSLSGNACLYGRVECERFSIHGNAEIVWTGETNTPPTVDAGNEAVIALTDTLFLQPIISDDGLPAEGELTCSWQKVSGPGLAYFMDSSVSHTWVRFSQPGDYILRLTADDGQFSTQDDVAVTVTEPGENAAPVVLAGIDQTVGGSFTAQLKGTVSDDGLPYDNFLRTAWHKLTGPGEVAFADSTSPETRAIFNLAGTYILRLTARDGEYETFDDVNIKIFPENLPPLVFAGEDLSVTDTETMLYGKIADDGLPADCTLSVTWSLVQGPGRVDFVNAHIPITRVIFGQEGDYVLRLSADDGENISSDEVVVQVSGNRAPLVNAGEDCFRQLTVPLNYDTLTFHQPPEPDDDWLYDIGRPGVNDYISSHGIDVIGNEIYISGIFDYAGGIETGCVAKWDGCGWSEFYDSRPRNPDNPSSPSLGLVYSVFNGNVHIGMKNDSVYIGGGFFSDINRPPDGIYEWLGQWTGIGWEPWRPFYLTFNFIGAYDICTSSEAVYLGGYFRFQPIDDMPGHWPHEPVPGVPECCNIAKWNGVSWEAVGDGITDINDSREGGPAGLVCSIASGPNGGLYAGGSFNMQTATGMAHHLARWNGEQWLAIAGDITGGFKNGMHWDQGGYPEVTDIKVAENGDVYICGNFTEVGGITTNCIAKGSWDEYSQQWNWTSVGIGDENGLNQKAYALALKDSSVYVGGRFSMAGTKTVKNVARWDGTEWQALDNGNVLGTNKDVLAMDAGEDAVFMGGRFYRAGGEPASHVVGWGKERKIRVTDFDSLLVENASQQGELLSLSATIYHECGEPVTLTWNIDGGDPEHTQTAHTGCPQCSCKVEFEYEFLPGNHWVTLTADDGSSVPVMKSVPVTVIAPCYAQLQGRVTDDGLPSSTTQYWWSLLQGPASVQWEDSLQENTRVYFETAGTYVLRLQATDGEQTRFDDVVVTVQEQGNDNQAPVVTAGQDKSIYVEEVLHLQGQASDDGLPGSSLTPQWSVVEGPGQVIFDNPNSLQTTVHFYVGGLYKLRLSVSDDELSTLDEMTVYVSPVLNQPPVVYGGEDITCAAHELVPLPTQVSDDGLLYGIFNYRWQRVGIGPDENRPRFRMVNNQFYVSFWFPGSNDIVLWATDGSYEASDTVHVNITSQVLSPEVAIHLPVSGSAVTEPVPIIGSVCNVPQPQWSLSLRKKGEETWTQIGFSNKQVKDSTLTVLDPTLMENGMYELYLFAEDGLGNQYTDYTYVVVKGGMKVGNFTISFEDLYVPVAGIPIQVVRTYDSRKKSAGDFGAGWSLDVRNVQVQETAPAGQGWRGMVRGDFIPFYSIEPTRPHVVTVTATDGSVHEFEVGLYPHYQAVPPATVELQFKSRFGTNSSLSIPDSPYLLVYGSFTRQGSEITLLGDDINNIIFDADKYVLTLRNGAELTLDEITGLEAFRDRNNNQITVTDNGIIHSSGQSVTFTRDLENRITAITDPMNHTIQYDYDTKGDLIRVTDQENYTTTFTYDDDHFLTDITDPRGITPARQLYDDTGRMIAMVDAEGDTIFLNHDLDSRQEVVRDRLGNITVYEYDDQGNVISKTDAKGNTWLYAYDELNNKISETDPEGNTRTWTYDDHSNLLSETDALGNTTIYTYNDQGQMLTKTDPEGGVTTYNYDENSNLISETDPLGHTMVRAYDGQGNLLSQSDNQGDIIQKEYDASGNVTKETDAFGHEISFTYDANGNQLTRTTTRTTASGTVTMTWGKTYDAKGKVTSVTDPAGSTSSTEYNELGKKAAEIDKLGRRTEYVYDDRGNNTEKIYADGTTETYTFDANGNRTSSTDRSGKTTFYEYDPQIDRIDKITFPTGGFINTDTDETGSYVAVSDDKGNTTRYQYDADGNLSKTINALGDSTVYTYDAAGNQTSMTDARGNTTSYEYELNGNKTKIIYADGTFTSLTYDARGNKTLETDQAGNTTEFAYDALDRLIKVTDALGNETTYTYDEVGNKLTATDAEGRTTSWEYDDLGRVIKRTLPLSQSEHFTYDAAGNVLSHTDFKENTTTFEYDQNNRVKKKTFPDATEETFTYTATGRQDTIIDSRGTTLNLYDSGDRLIKAVNPAGTSLEYRYDSMGNRTAVIVDTDTTRYTFDDLNRLKTVTDPEGGVTTYTYDPVGNRSSVSYPNGSVAEYTYNSLNRLTKLFNHKANGDTVSCYEYTLGPAGNRTQVTEHTGRTVQYDYDVTYKLIQESIDDPDFGVRVFSYEYDQVGNRLLKVDDEDSTHYAYDVNDRLLTENEIVYFYDDNGNTQLKVEGLDSTKYEYDFQNRLIQVDDGTDVVEYWYDTDGMRMKKAVNGTVTKFLLDKNRNYSQVIEERDNTDSTLVRYTYGDDLISQKRGSLTSYYHYDGQLSTRQLSDASQNITDSYTYDAFGLLLNRTGATENNYLYTGEQYDPNCGFYYLRARYYNASVGRFLTMDTFPGMQFEPASLHKYLYCEGNPVGKWDPSGRLTLLEIGTTLSMRICLTNVIMIKSILLLPYVIFAEVVRPILFHASKSREFALFALSYTGIYTEEIHGLVYVNKRIIGRTILLLGMIMGVYSIIEELIQDAITLHKITTAINDLEKICRFLEFAARHADEVVKLIYKVKRN